MARSRSGGRLRARAPRLLAQSASVHLQRCHHQDQNSTRKVRERRRFTRSIMRRSPQSILAMPVIPGFRNRALLSISVVMRIAFGGCAALEMAAPEIAFAIEAAPLTVIATDVTFP